MEAQLVRELMSGGVPSLSSHVKVNLNRLYQLTFAVLALAMLGLASCSPKVAFQERVLRQPDAVRFGCVTPPSPAVTTGTTLVFVGVKDMRNPQARVAGQYDSPMNPLDFNTYLPPIALPFHPDTDPVVVITSDLKRLLTAHGLYAEGQAPAAPSPRLEVDLIAAFGEARMGCLSCLTSQVLGYVVFDVALFIDPENHRPFWYARIVGNESVRTAYVTKQNHEEALNRSYCQALQVFENILHTEEFQAALRGGR